MTVFPETEPFHARLSSPGLIALFWVCAVGLAGCAHHSKNKDTAGVFKHPTAQDLAEKPKVRVNVWLDPETGKVAQCQLLDHTGNHEVDRSIENSVLTSVQLPPLPPGLPMPITLRFDVQQSPPAGPQSQATVSR